MQSSKIRIAGKDEFPALITEAQGRDIERITGVPIVTLTYDGTGTPINDRIIPYLRYPRKVN
jgi:hypothetical protein